MDRKAPGEGGCRKKLWFECPLNQYDLADALRLSAVHVNRMLRDLRELGFLEFRHGSVQFLNREGLEHFAGFDPGYLRLPGET